MKNCPACRQYQVGVYTCDDLYDCDLQRCQDCTDCVIKQIVELCRKNLNSLETYVDVRSLECTVLQNILQLLDIQEVE
jgi:hypothetical protein